MKSPDVPINDRSKLAKDIEDWSGLPHLAQLKLQLLRARHEEQIHAAAARRLWFLKHARRRPGFLDCQDGLQKLVIEMAIDLGEKEARECLEVADSPELFEAAVKRIVERVVKTAESRFLEVLSCGDPEPKPEDGPPVLIEIRQLIHDELVPRLRELIARAWTNQAERLAAEISFEESESKHRSTPGVSAQLPPSASKSGGLEREPIAQQLDWNSPTEQAASLTEAEEAPSTPRRRRGRPTKISDELKRKALDADGGKAQAQVLYKTNIPTVQQVKSTSTILRKFKQSRSWPDAKTETIS